MATDKNPSELSGTLQRVPDRRGEKAKRATSYKPKVLRGGQGFFREGDLERLRKTGLLNPATHVKNTPLADAAPVRASLGTSGISGAKEEGLLNKALATVLTSWGVPETDFEATAAELERVARARANVARRPKWDERGKYAELKDLSAPQFLKRVYADVIASDGSIKKKTIRDIDPRLMMIVEGYINKRKTRNLDMGEAAGLKLIAGQATAAQAKLG